GKTLLHGGVLMWLMKTLLTSRCVNQRGAGHKSFTVHINKKLKGSEYLIYEGSILSLSHELSQEAIEERWEIFKDKNK
ncbi:hypothetical protein, partial [Enterobacter kobei]|uniref:hypothetical protein n=1 Tax=Enterobacter kobei TaxID=208224 RepID=UPI0020056918